MVGQNNLMGMLYNGWLDVIIVNVLEDLTLRLRTIYEVYVELFVLTSK